MNYEHCPINNDYLATCGCGVVAIPLKVQEENV